MDLTASSVMIPPSLLTPLSSYSDLLSFFSPYLIRSASFLPVLTHLSLIRMSGFALSGPFPFLLPIHHQFHLFFRLIPHYVAIPGFLSFDPPYYLPHTHSLTSSYLVIPFSLNYVILQRYKLELTSLFHLNLPRPFCLSSPHSSTNLP